MAPGTGLPLAASTIRELGRVRELVCRWVAGHRYRFLGVTLLCKSDPAAVQRLVCSWLSGVRLIGSVLSERDPPLNGSSNAVVSCAQGWLPSAH